MNINDLRALSPKELQAKLTETRGKLFVLRFQIASGKTNDFFEVTRLKRLIAKILTIISESKRNSKTNIESKTSSEKKL